MTSQQPENMFSGNITEEASLFDYFSESWATYNVNPDFEPAFPPDMVSPEVEAVCQGKLYFFLEIHSYWLDFHRTRFLEEL